jgi:hypothetical protein
MILWIVLEPPAPGFRNSFHRNLANGPQMPMISRAAGLPAAEMFDPFKEQPE